MLARFADRYGSGETPNTTTLWTPSLPAVAEILAYHNGRRATNGPIEGINNLHPSPMTRRPRIHQLRRLRSPRHPCNMSLHAPGRDHREGTTTWALT